MPKGTTWTTEENEILKERYHKLKITDLIKLLPNRTESSIINRAKRLNLNNNYNKWTIEEEDKLKELFPFNTIDELLVHFPNRTSNSITGKAKELKLKKDPSHIQETQIRVATRWTENEDNILRKYYPTGGYKAVIEHLPYKNERSIVSRTSKLGIKRMDRYGREWNREIVSLTDYGSNRKAVIRFTRTAEGEN